LPATVAVLVGVMVAVAAIRAVLPEAWDISLVVHLGLVLFLDGSFLWDRLHTLVSSVFLHGGWLHLAFNAFWLATIGSILHPFLGPLRFLALFLASGVAGGLTLLVTNWGETMLVIGASGAVFGLFGAAAHVLVAKPWLPRAERYKRLSVFAVIILLFNLALGYAEGVPGAEGLAIAWQVHIGGFLCGLLLFPLLARRPRAETGSAEPSNR
jgi:membrane associated rhomboid family serine protease